MSADTANGCCLKRRSTLIGFCFKSGPVSNDLLRDAPWNLAAPFSTLRNVFGLTTVWCGKYHSRSKRLSIL